MNENQGSLSPVMLVMSIFCMVLLVAGMALLVSPFYITAGLIGWLQGYEPKNDVLAIAWLVNVLGSMFIGVVMITTSAVTGVWLGLVSAFVGMTSRQTPDETLSQTEKLDEPEILDE